jgi:hypothetical protein
MLLLSVVWLVLGALLGALANGARLGLRARGVAGWWATWATLALGALGALACGWLGAALFGRPFGTPMALWGGALAATLGPWLVQRLRQSPRFRRAATPSPR